MTKHSTTQHSTERSATAAGTGPRGEKAVPHIASREGCAMQWNGQSGVREYRVDATARPDSHAPDEEPRRICIGEVCEPMS